MSFIQVKITGEQSHCNAKRIGKVELEQLTPFNIDRPFYIDIELNIYQDEVNEDGSQLDIDDIPKIQGCH